MQVCNQFPFAGVCFLYPLENNMLMQQVEWAKPVVHIYDKGVHNNADILELDGFRIGRIQSANICCSWAISGSHLSHLRLKQSR